MGNAWGRDGRSMGVCDDVAFAWVRLLARGKRQTGREVRSGRVVAAGEVSVDRRLAFLGWRMTWMAYDLDGARMVTQRRLPRRSLVRCAWRRIKLECRVQVRLCPFG